MLTQAEHEHILTWCMDFEQLKATVLHYLQTAHLKYSVGHDIQQPSKAKDIPYKKECVFTVQQESPHQHLQTLLEITLTQPTFHATGLGLLEKPGTLVTPYQTVEFTVNNAAAQIDQAMSYFCRRQAFEAAGGGVDKDRVQLFKMLKRMVKEFKEEGDSSLEELHEDITILLDRYSPQVMTLQEAMAFCTSELGAPIANTQLHSSLQHETQMANNPKVDFAQYIANTQLHSQLQHETKMALCKRLKLLVTDLHKHIMMELERVPPGVMTPEEALAFCTSELGAHV